MEGLYKSIEDSKEDLEKEYGMPFDELMAKKGLVPVNFEPVPEEIFEKCGRKVLGELYDVKYDESDSE